MAAKRKFKPQGSVRLPSLYESWPHLSEDLKSLADKRLQGLDALESVLARHDRWGNIRLPLTLLKSALEGGFVCTVEHFSSDLLPWMAKTARQVERLFKESGCTLENLHTGRECEVVLTRRQACCLLCLAFFNCFEPQQGSYNQFTLSGFLSSAPSKSQKSKLLCLLNYFECVRSAEEAGNEEFLSMCVSVSRHHGNAGEAMWRGCERPLLPFESLDHGVIENAHGCLQVDFANAYIGGGVLRKGCVQVCKKSFFCVGYFFFAS